MTIDDVTPDDNSKDSNLEPKDYSASGFDYSHMPLPPHILSRETLENALYSGSKVERNSAAWADFLTKAVSCYKKDAAKLDPEGKLEGMIPTFEKVIEKLKSPVGSEEGVDSELARETLLSEPAEYDKKALSGADEMLGALPDKYRRNIRDS